MPADVKLALVKAMQACVTSFNDAATKLLEGGSSAQGKHIDEIYDDIKRLQNIRDRIRRGEMK